MYFCMLDTMSHTSTYKWVKITPEQNYRSIWQGEPSHFEQLQLKGLPLLLFHLGHHHSCFALPTEVVQKASKL